MSNNKDPHITGKYAIIAALIGAAALFGNTYYKHYLATSLEGQSPKTESKNPPKEQIDNKEKRSSNKPYKKKIDKHANNNNILS